MYTLPGFDLSHSIDRIDNNRGYEPGNLRWADDVTQARNTRGNVKVTYAGETLCLKEFVERFCYVTYNYARQRYAKGATLEELIAMPPGQKSGHAARLRFDELRTKK